MTISKTPPMPESLKQLLAQPLPPPLIPLDRKPDAGTAWEVRMPDGAVELFLIVEDAETQVDDFAVCRAVPITELIGLVHLEDDAFVLIKDSNGENLCGALTHCEGPIATTALIRCVGEAIEDSMQQVQAKRDKSPGRLPQHIYLFRSDLFEQMDALYKDSWRLLYETLDVGDERN